MNIKEKLRQYAKTKGLSPTKLSQMIGQSDGYLRTDGNVYSNVIAQIRKVLTDLNIDWLLFDEGNMIISKNNQTNEPQVSYGLQTTPSGTPYFDVDFESGFTFLENNQTTKPTSYINHPFFATSDIVVRNSGQSMAKVIKHGDAIGLKHLPMWREFLALGEIYALVLIDDRRLVKVIAKGENKDNYTLISKPTDNKKEEFQPQQIKKSFIRTVFKVEAYSGLF